MNTEPAVVALEEPRSSFLQYLDGMLGREAVDAAVARLGEPQLALLREDLATMQRVLSRRDREIVLTVPSFYAGNRRERRAQAAIARRTR